MRGVERRWRRPKPRPHGPTSRAARLALAAGVLAFLTHAAGGFAQEPAEALAARALGNELHQIDQGQHYSCMSEERSSRTGGHLWVEKLVQTEEGEVHRLLSVDGSPLSPAKAKEEDERIQKGVARADAKRQADRSHGEESASTWIQTIQRALIFSYDHKDEGGTLLRYRPNPEFSPANYRERIVHALEGTLLVKEPEDRIAAVDARVSQPVEIGYGLLGRLEEDSRMHVVRSALPGGSWQVTQVQLHVLGRLLLLKNISQDLDMKRSAFHDVPAHLTLQQAADMTRP